ncbi:MAG: hypothetical protein RBT66_09755 [bacterium]|nr:hypothetical protein [bacterium]
MKTQWQSALRQPVEYNVLEPNILEDVLEMQGLVITGSVEDITLDAILVVLRIAERAIIEAQAK